MRERTLIKAPHLDSLAARGVRSTQATCNAPMCVPSRYSKMTGLYPSQVGVRHNTQMIPTDEGLREMGFQTAGFGKTHWYLGEMLGDRHRYSKYCLYDASVRGPMILAGSGVPEELHGTTDDRHAELVDVLPTLLSAAGEATPLEFPSVSLLSDPVRAAGFAEMHGMGYEPDQRVPAYMWRTRDWKLVSYLPATRRTRERPHRRANCTTCAQVPTSSTTPPTTCKRVSGSKAS